MAYISVTNTFTNLTAADAAQVNTNFSDIINGTSDGTKDFSIAALTVAGVLTANGNVILGNASSDDLTITASLASTIPIKTNTTFNFGDATHGLAALYLGASSTFTTKVVSATQAASRIVTVPVVDADTNFMLQRGTQTNDSASAGDIGEYISSINASATTGSTGVWKDITSITLTAGDWDIGGGLTVGNSGATLTRLYTCIGTVSGDDQTGAVSSESLFEIDLPTTTRDTSFAYSNYRRSISSTTTYYLKFRGTYTVSDIDAAGSIWARRVR